MFRIAALAGAAMIASISIGQAASLTVTQPPKRYDHAHPRLVVVEVPARDVRKLCGTLFGRGNFAHYGRVHGCASVGDSRKSCIIIMPKRTRFSAAEHDALFRHERAHCNGWAGSHPGP
jgi:hypothetical protein